MTDKKKIKQEIERRFNDNMKASEQYTENSKSHALFTSAAKEDYDLLAFIDSLPEEPASEDLEEYYKKEFLPKEWFAKPGQRTISQFNFFTARHFAEWQRKKDQETIELAEDHAMFAGMEKMREEMMKDAVEAEVVDGYKYIPHAALIVNKNAIGQLETGDKVKLIIIKEDGE